MQPRREHGPRQARRDIGRLERNIDAVNPAALTMRVSARTGEGIGAFREWLIGVPARSKAAAWAPAFPRSGAVRGTVCDRRYILWRTRDV